MDFKPTRMFSHDLLGAELQRQCSGCHLNPGDTLHRRIKGNCAQCHRIDGWAPANFEHARYFFLDRDHDTTCETCHLNGDYGRYTCYGCHEHSRSRIREEHFEEGIRNFGSCVECHRSGDEDEAEWRWRSRGLGGEAGGGGYESEGEGEGGYGVREYDE